MNTFENHKKSTSELLELIKNSPNDLDSLLDDLESEQLDMSIADYFNMIMTRKNLTPAQIVNNSNLQKTYAHQIISGERKHPSRNKLLALGFATGLSPEEMQQLLKVARLPVLYPRRRQDLVILFALKEHYHLTDVNEILLDLGEELLE